MSLTASTWVWKHSSTKGSHKLVLLALADHADESGRCWPSMTTLAKKCGLERRYVINLLHYLEESGHIRVERRGRQSNLYTIVGVVNPASLSDKEEVVNPASPGSEPRLTSVVNPASPGSEPRLTSVVNPASPEPLLNHQLNRQVDPSIDQSRPLPADSAKTRRKSRANPQTKHPAIQAIFRITGRFPQLDAYPGLIEVLGDNPDMTRLQACWAEWRSRGYSPLNFGWVVDWYQHGGPARSGDTGVGSSWIQPVQDLEGEQIELDEIPKAAPALPDLDIDSEALRWWYLAKDQLQQEINITAWRQYVEPARLVGSNPTGLLIGAPTPFVRDWLDQRVKSTFIRILSGVANRRLDIEFTVQESL